ncbi:MAG: branched-chain amino acid ABC transporter permease [Streptosporangiaceae bacterium]
MHIAVFVALNFLTALSVLVLIGFSLGLIFGQLRIINLAQGDLVMFGAYVVYAMRGFPFWVGVVVALALGTLLALAIERGIMRRLYARGFMPALLATWGIGIVLRQAAQAIFSSTPRSVAAPIAGSTTVLGVQYPVYRLVLAGVVAIVVIAALVVAYRTAIGLRIRASIDNVDMASVLGISPRRMFALVFTVGTLLAVLAGALAAPIIGLTPTVGLGYLAPAFFAVLLGRPGSIGGPVLGAAVVSALTVVLEHYFTATVAQTLVFAALVALIAIKPEGIQWHLPARIRRPLDPAPRSGQAPA